VTCAARYVADVWNVKGLVGQDQAGELALVEDPRVGGSVASVALKETVLAQEPEVVGMADRYRTGNWYDAALGIASLNIIKKERVDFGHLEPSEHNIFAQYRQVFEFCSKGLVVPFPGFGDPIKR
jgi:hypothetical protein